MGRFLSTDPLTALTPWESPYVFAGNGPILNIDWLGLKKKDGNYDPCPKDFGGGKSEKRSKGERKALRERMKENRKARASSRNTGDASGGVNTASGGKSEATIAETNPPDNQSVIIYLSGLYSDGSSNQGSSSDKDKKPGRTFDSDYEISIRKAMESNYPNIQYKMESFNSVGLDYRTKDDAAKFIDENLGKNGQLIIIGYSWGGDTALELTWPTPMRYNPINRNIDLLIIVDAADGPISRPLEKGKVLVGPYAQNIYNFYQLYRQLLPPTLSGVRILAPSRQYQTIRQEVMTSKDGFGNIDHSNIDEATVPYITNLATRKLANQPLPLNWW